MTRRRCGVARRPVAVPCRPRPLVLVRLRRDEAPTVTNPHHGHAVPRPAFAACALSAAALAAACGGESTGPETRSGLRIVAHPVLEDTAGAAPTQALVVEVLDPDGKRAAESAVRVVVERIGTGRPFEHAITLCPVTVVQCPEIGLSTPTPSVQVNTNAEGRAVVTVRFGSLAGQARVRVTVPEFGYAEDLLFTTNPGAAVGAKPAVADTALLVNESIQAVAHRTDRYGNLRPELIAPSSITAPLIRMADGRIVAQAVGRAQVNYTVGTSTITSFVSVVPTGSYAAVDPVRQAIIISSFDGRQRREFASASPEILGVAGVAWSPDGRWLLYGGSAGWRRTPIYRLDTESGVATEHVTPTDDVSSIWWGRYSADGSSIYYSALVGGQWYLHRSRGDGTGGERIGPPREPARVLEWRGDPSRDGRTLAYVTTTDGTPRIRVLDVVTGVVTPLDVPGQTPRVSPDGQLIAFVPERGGELRLVPVSGGTPRAVPTPNGFVHEGAVSWSPDGEWLIVGAGGALHLVRLATGTTIPLPGTAGRNFPAWQP